ncbi:MAG: RNA polymerase sigma factor region1.1 domain-containing protein, partial [Thermodesulfobacteriota bacterium]
MDKNNDIVSLKRLIDNGKDRGYITFEELNDDLSDDIVSSEEHIDDLMMMFEELDIMVIDEAAKKKIEKDRKAKKKTVAPEDKTAASFELPDVSSRGSDPVKMYLREMGRISLLTREGEVEIAKRIEAGEKEALETLLLCSVGVEHIIDLGEELVAGAVKLKDVINDLEDDDSYVHMGERKDSLLGLIQQMRELNEGLRAKRRQKMSSKCSDKKKKALAAQIKEDQKKIMALAGSFSLEKRQIDLMVDRFRQFMAEVDQAEKDIAECMLRAGGKSISYVNKSIGKLPKTAKADHVVKPLG